MIRKNALLMASALTAFVLVMVGGIAGRLSNVASAEESQPSTPAAVLDDAALAALLQEREGVYRDMIDQANQLLAATATAPAAPTFPINADTAVAIVLTTVRGGSLEKPPELVDYMGAAAYEVSLTQGLVYVDANTGKILANGAIPQVVVVGDNAGGNGGGGQGHSGDYDDQHEEEDSGGDD
ncbi:MAG: PepSY domain-containing protein [Anaerolineales bacterium]|nr:PepSY domain-containing protein [Anaerolineales bacterium]